MVKRKKRVGESNEGMMMRRGRRSKKTNEKICRRQRREEPLCDNFQLPFDGLYF